MAARRGSVRAGGVDRAWENCDWPPGPLHEHDQFLCHGPGHAGSVVVLEQRESHVDTGTDTRGGEIAAIVHMQSVGLDLDAREPACEGAGVAPVGGGAVTIE
ncbi:hypothetical protein [Nocardia sp. AB354]|uniref:hypothetical protein n=1 Tax=Nocardia sp. AB354 TaxID=3413283 RepID=UPI003C1A0252